MKKSVVSVSIMMALCSIVINANAAGFGFQFHSGPISIDPEVAEREGIEDSGVSLGMEFYGIALDHIRFGAGAFTTFISDNDQYEVLVEDQFGNVSDAESTIGFTVAYIESGLTARPFSRVRTDLLLGYGIYEKAVRSVSNCSDCPSDELDVPVNAYIKPRISYLLHVDDYGHYGIGLEYSHFLGDSGVENAIMLSIGMEASF